MIEWISMCRFTCNWCGRTHKADKYGIPLGWVASSHNAMEAKHYCCLKCQHEAGADQWTERADRR